MREIKFRAWDKEEKFMYEIGRLELPWEYDIPVMQFTGLKDKNGKEIYEGDIVKADDTEKPLPIVYDPPWFTLKDWKHGLTYIIEHDELEVIGNIYKNPELLEARQ